MSLFNRGDDDDADDETEYVEQEVTKEVSYTEHEAEIVWTGGESEPVTFDGIEERENSLVLKNFTGYSSKGMYRGFHKEAFMTVPYANLLKLETTNRTKRTMEYETTEKVPVDDA